MTDAKGHFENGKWVLDKEEPATAAPSATAAPTMETRMNEAAKSVTTAFEDVIRVGRDLFETDQGRQYMEKTVKDAGAGFQKAFQDILSRAQDEIDRKARKK
jgi:hypothetical protein